MRVHEASPLRSPRACIDEAGDATSNADWLCVHFSTIMLSPLGPKWRCPRAEAQSTSLIAFYRREISVPSKRAEERDPGRAISASRVS